MTEELAEAFATKAHADQKRRGTGEPYIVHPRDVVRILKTHLHNPFPHLIMAGWLHDTIEDCGISIATLCELFGADTANLVSEVTDVSTSRDGNRAKRKLVDIYHLSQASPLGKTLKLADIVSNVSTVVKHDPEFAKVYLVEKSATLAVLMDGNSVLWSLANKLIGEGMAALTP